MLLNEAREAGWDVNSATHDAVVDVLGQVLYIRLPLTFDCLLHSIASHIKISEKIPHVYPTPSIFTVIQLSIYI